MSAPNEDGTERRYVEFHPSVWDDHFLSYASSCFLEDREDEKAHRKLKEEVKMKLMAHVDDKPSRQLELIDVVLRLGVSYHFENEIRQTLSHTYLNGLGSKARETKDDYDDHDDLQMVSLWFRLLRQQGFRVSSDVFTRFKDEKGNFKNSLVSDVHGLLSLYEAAQLRVHGEDILDEALLFTTTHLQSIATETNLGSLAHAQVTHALKQPIHKGMQRLEARFYISIYERDPSCDEILLNFAKLDFNKLQKLHQKELSHIVRWWRDLRFSEKLPFARDRLVECYFWILGVFFEPQYVTVRRMLTKVIALTSTIDDIFDVYGRIEELELFADAIEKWDMARIENLPEYMRVCYRAIFDTYAEIEEIVSREGKFYKLYYAKEAMKKQVRAYLKEARWFHSKYVPTLEEYMSVALPSSGHALLAFISFVGMHEDFVTEHVFEWLISRPKVLTASESVARLMDDIASHEFEQKRGHVASSIECYMKQYDATEEEAVAELRRQISDAWKDTNEECLTPTKVPMTCLFRILNITRVIDVIYKEGDGYTNAATMLKDDVVSLLIDPVAVGV